MTFELSIELDNAAFEDNPRELAGILEYVAGDGRLTSPQAFDGGNVLDSNGNTVGRWTIS